MSKAKTISIVIPLYNEEKRIVTTFPKIIEFLEHFVKNKKLSTELVFVNDGSKDNTKQILRKLFRQKQTHPQITITFATYPKNMGKGFALRKGFKKASGDFILFMDADLSTPLKHLKVFVEKMEEKQQIIIGSRKMKGAKVKKHQPWIRENLGKGFTLLSNIFLVWGISDFTCGFKMFPKKQGKHLFSLLTINRWGFDSEVLFLAKKHKYKILEIPVEWINDSSTKVNLKRDVFQSLKEIIQIRINNLKKLYG